VQAVLAAGIQTSLPEAGRLRKTAATIGEKMFSSAGNYDKKGEYIS
jgi:hypothetical protein